MGIVIASGGFWIGRGGVVRGKKIMELVAWLVAMYAVICAVAYFGNLLFML